MDDGVYMRLVKSLTPEQTAWLDECEQLMRKEERGLVYAELGLDPPDDPGSGWVPPAIRGEVGTIEGPPIDGTNDRVNSGIAKAALTGEVIVHAPVEVARAPWPRWQPAGEVGTILDSGTQLIEEPKNDARAVAQPKQIGYVVPEGWSADRPGLCRSCKADIMWATTPAGKPSPLNPDGTSHFATCPQADSWRKR